MPRTSRRQFAKTIAAASALLPAATLIADEPEVPAVLAGELATLFKSELERRKAAIEDLRKFELENRDEPDVTFSASAKRW